MTTAEQARIALNRIKDSGSGRSVVELGWIGEIRVESPRAIVRLNLPGFAQSQRERLAQETRLTLQELEGISEVQIELGNSPKETTKKSILKTWNNIKIKTFLSYKKFRN